jgi:hypothetical protein
MWLRVTEATETTLWQGALTPAETDRSVDRGEGRSVGAALDGAGTRDLPVVSIGQPEVWSLPDVYAPKKLPPALRAKLDEANFYLVRLSCSFRPKSGGTQVEWARLAISLLPDAVGRAPLAFDLHPLLVTNEVKRNVKVTISPSLKFNEVEASVGSADFGLEYTELQPIVSAAGAGEARPSWDYSAGKGVGLNGSKWMHLLVKAPREMQQASARLEMVADVTKKGFRIPMFAKPDRTAADPFTVRLWG